MEYANQSDTPEQKKKGKYESIGRETTVRSTKKDIVDQIKEMYIDRTQRNHPSYQKVEYLVPTKATLFGLDVRFREIDKKVAEEREKKNASRIKISSARGNSARQNRHQVPKNIHPSTIQLARQLPPNKYSTKTNRANNPMAQSVNQPSKLRTLEQSDNYRTLRPNQSSVSPLKLAKNGNESSMNILLDINSVGETKQSTGVGASTVAATIAALGGIPSSSQLDLLQMEKKQVSITTKNVNAPGSSSPAPEAYSQQGRYTTTNLTQMKSTIDKEDHQAQVLSLPSIQKPKVEKHHSCYDEMINERLFQKIPKNISYKKQFLIDEQKKAHTIEGNDLAKKNQAKAQKNLARSAVDQLIITTKSQLKTINTKLKQQQMAEQEAERQKMFAGGDTNNQGAANQLQVIKKAQIFADAEYKDNIKRMMHQSRVIENELQLEEDMKRKHKEEVILKEKDIALKMEDELKRQMTRGKDSDSEGESGDDKSGKRSSQSQESLTFTEREAVKQQLKKEEEDRKSKKPIYANRTQLSKMISNEFLFGEHVEADTKILKQLELRDKRAGPKVKKRTEEHKMHEEPQHEKLFGKNGAKKADVNMHKYKSYGWDIHVDMFQIRAQQLIPQKQKLSPDEKRRLKEAKEDKLLTFKKECKDQFNSEKNYSIMMSKKDNEIRNQIMQKFKYKQKKNMKLREYMRKEREKIIADRDDSEEEREQTPSDQQWQKDDLHDPDAYKANKALKDRLQTGKKLEQEKLMVKQYRSDFVQFFKEKICPGNTGFGDTDPGAQTQASSRASGGFDDLKNRPKNRPQDSVEQIADNISNLIKFGREKQKKLNELKRHQMAIPDWGKK